MADLKSLIRNPFVLGGAAVVIAGMAAGGYFLLKPAAPKFDASGKPIPSLCEATLTRVTDYGLIEAGAKLVSTEPTKTATKTRMICQAKSGTTVYSMTVDVACDDVSDFKCLSLHSVTDSAGQSLYRRHM